MKTEKEAASLKILGYVMLVWLMALLLQAPVFAQEPAAAGADQAAAAQAAQELAKKLSNPIASLISFPLQLNYDTGYGPANHGARLYVNVQPVIPITLSPQWNLISRTILPVISQTEMFPGAGDQFGLGDVTQSLFFSPSAPIKSGLIWGAGPVLLLPTATNDMLGNDRWGAGPTIVVLKQQGGQTIGLLANHIWSVDDNDERSDINTTFLQPFLSFTTPKATTYSFNTEATYNWDAEEWTIPINLSVSQLTKLVKQPVSLSFGLRYWVEAPEEAPNGLGLRLGVTYLFPK